MAKTQVRGTQILDGSVDLTVDVENILSVPNGGTGVNTLPSNNLIVGNDTSAVLSIAPGASGNVLASNGTIWASTINPTAVPQVPSAGYMVATNTQVLFFTDIDMQAANGDLTINGLLQGIH